MFQCVVVVKDTCVSLLSVIMFVTNVLKVVPTTRLKGRLRKVFLNGIPGTGIRIPLAFRHLPRSIFVVH